MVAKKTKTRFSAPELGRSVSRRPSRVGEAIRNEIAALLLRKTNDPRLFRVNITSVDVSPDLRHAKVYFDCADEYIDGAQAGLASAKGFIRSSLAKVLTMKFMPDLHFVHDLASAKHEEIGRLFAEIENERSNKSSE